MTTALASISSYRNTKVILNPHRTITSNHTLNAILLGLLDKDGVLDDEDDFVDDDGAVDDDKRDAYMAHQGEEEERNSNPFLTLMNTVEIDTLEQREADVEDLRRHCQRFLGQIEKKAKVQASVVLRPSYWEDAESDPETERLVARLH
jgi:hypothetical protein